MPRNSKSQGPGARGQDRPERDLKRKIRIVLGALLALNLIAAGLVLFPPGGSADDLERELATLQSQIMQKRALLERTPAQCRRHRKGARGRRPVSGQLLSEPPDSRIPLCFPS